MSPVIVLACLIACTLSGGAIAIVLFALDHIKDTASDIEHVRGICTEQMRQLDAAGKSLHERFADFEMRLNALDSMLKGHRK